MDRSEAIKVIKDNWPESRPQLSEALQTLIPEFQESEDERIKKEIIQFLQLPHPQFVGKRNHEEWIAWLEKQGHDGKKWIYEDAYIKEKEQVFQDGIDEVLENPQRYGLEKQDEQKPTDKVEPKFKVGDTIVEKDLDECGCGTIVNIKDDKYIFDNGCFIRIKEQEGWQLVKTPTTIEQKPAWSEEDDRNLSIAIQYVFEHGYLSVVNWLKSLKERHTKISKEDVSKI